MCWKNVEVKHIWRNFLYENNYLLFSVNHLNIAIKNLCIYSNSTLQIQSKIQILDSSLLCLTLCFLVCFFPELRMMAEGRFASLPRSLHAHHTLGGGTAHPGVPSNSLGAPSSSTCSSRRLQASLASSMDLLSSRPGWDGWPTVAHSTKTLVFKEPLQQFLV